MEDGVFDCVRCDCFAPCSWKLLENRHAYRYMIIRVEFCQTNGRLADNKVSTSKGSAQFSKLHAECTMTKHMLTTHMGM